MKKTVIAVGLVAIMIVGIVSAYAAGPGFGPGNGPKNRGGFCGAMNLAPDQETTIKDLRQKHFDESAQVRERMLTLRQELRTLWADPNAKPETLQSKTREMNDLRGQMQEKMVQHRLEVRDLLTPEQIEQMGSGCGKGCGKGPGYGQGPGYGRGRN